MLYFEVYVARGGSLYHTPTSWPSNLPSCPRKTIVFVQSNLCFKFDELVLESHMCPGPRHALRLILSRYIDTQVNLLVFSLLT